MSHPLKACLCSVLLLVPFAAPAQDEAAEPAAAEAPEVTETDAPADTDAGAGSGAAAEEEETSGFGTVDVFYAPSTVARVGGEDEDGTGYGARAIIKPMKYLGVLGEYQTRSFDAEEFDVDELRLGVGGMLENGSGDSFGAFVQYDDFSSDLSDLKGFSVHGRLMRQFNDWLQWHFAAGRLFLESDDEKQEGNEFTVGLVANMGPVGIVAEGHAARVSGRTSGVRSTLSDARVGLRLSF